MENSAVRVLVQPPRRHPEQLARAFGTCSQQIVHANVRRSTAYGFKGWGRGEEEKRRPFSLIAEYSKRHIFETILATVCVWSVIQYFLKTVRVNLHQQCTLGFNVECVVRQALSSSRNTLGRNGGTSHENQSKKCWRKCRCSSASDSQPFVSKSGFLDADLDVYSTANLKSW